MKKSTNATLLLTILGFATANRPQLSIQIRDGDYTGLDAIDPSISWENSITSNDIDFEYGIDAAARPTSDLSTLPRKIWGRARTDISGWDVTVGADINPEVDRTCAHLEVDAGRLKDDVSVKLVSRVDRKNLHIERIETAKGFRADNGARVIVNPRYNMASHDGAVVLIYDKDRTKVKLVASANAQEVTVSRQIDDLNRVSPTFTSNGDVALTWERRLGDNKSILATLRPNDSIDLIWRDDAWTANIHMPIEGMDVSGANVSIKRDVRF